MFDHFGPESAWLFSQILVLLHFTAQQRCSVFIKLLFSELINIFFQYLMHKGINVLGQFVRVLDVWLHQNRHTKNASVVIRKRHHNVSKLFLCPQVIKCRFFDKSLSQILQDLCSNLEGFILEVNNDRAVCVLFWMQSLFNNRYLRGRKENWPYRWYLLSS